MLTISVAVGVCEVPITVELWSCCEMSWSDGHVCGKLFVDLLCAFSVLCRHAIACCTGGELNQ